MDLLVDCEEGDAVLAAVGVGLGVDVGGALALGIDGDGVVDDAFGSEIEAVDPVADLGRELLEGESLGGLEDDDLLTLVRAVLDGVLWRRSVNTLRKLSK